MGSHLRTADGVRLFEQVQASGLDLQSTRMAVGFWLEGLLLQIGRDPVDRLLGLLVPMAHAQRVPEAWFNWVTHRPWTTVVPDDQIRFVMNGPPTPARKASDCGLVSLAEAVAASF